MALTYAVVWGVAIADSLGPSPALDDRQSVVQVNGLVFLVAGG